MGPGGSNPREFTAGAVSTRPLTLVLTLARRSNEVWAVDITYVPTAEGWLYLAVVLDLYSRRVIGWSMAGHLRADLALDALAMAIQTRSATDLTGLVHHSDRGVQYASDAYQSMLGRHGITGSMSRTGNCWDNAVVAVSYTHLTLPTMCVV